MDYYPLGQNMFVQIVCRGKPHVAIRAFTRRGEDVKGGRTIRARTLARFDRAQFKVLLTVGRSVLNGLASAETSCGEGGAKPLGQHPTVG